MKRDISKEMKELPTAHLEQILRKTDLIIAGLDPMGVRDKVLELTGATDVRATLALKKVRRLVAKELASREPA